MELAAEKKYCESILTQIYGSIRAKINVSPWNTINSNNLTSIKIGKRKYK
jgi:hypothetical protein